MTSALVVPVSGYTILSGWVRRRRCPLRITVCGALDPAMSAGLLARALGWTLAGGLLLGGLLACAGLVVRFLLTGRSGPALALVDAAAQRLHQVDDVSIVIADLTTEGRLGVECVALLQLGLDQSAQLHLVVVGEV